MKAIEQHFHVVLFIMLYKAVLNLSLWIKTLCVTIQVEATEHCVHMILFMKLYKMGLIKY